MTGPVVGVVCALRSEARHLGRTLSGPAGLESLTDGMLLAVTGMGLPAAASGAERLVAAGAGALASFGMAGGLDPRLRAGSLFLPSEVAVLDGSVLPSDARWRAQVAHSLNALSPLSAGRLLSSPTAVVTAVAKAALWRSGVGSAVDMESAAVAGVSRRHGLPFIAIRVIVDDARADLPGAVGDAMRADGQVSVWRVLAHLLREPAQLGPLVGLARAYSAANRTLAAAARHGQLWPRALTAPLETPAAGFQ